MEFNRQMNMDYLRIFACLMVIFLHVSAQHWYDTDVAGLEWKVFNSYDCLVRSAVPLFFMISGKLFLSRSDMKSISDFFKQNIFKLIVVYFLWSLFYALDQAVVNHEIGLRSIVVKVLSSHYHLWYLPALIGVYFMLPILFSIAKYNNGKYIKYTCIMFFVFCILKTSFCEIKFLPESLYTMINRFEFPLGEYCGYFLLGYFLDIHKNRFRKLKLYFLLPLFLTFVFIASTINLAYANHLGQATDLFYGYYSIFVFMEAVVIFLIFNNMQEFNLPMKTKKIIIQSSKYTLFVYLFHPFVIDKLQRYLSISTLSINPVVSVPAISIFIFIICLFVSYILDHIPFVSNWIM